ICAATTAVRPAAGPLTLAWDPLKAPTIMPPTIPATTPESNGALDASATPRHNGSATRDTIRPAARSRDTITGEGSIVVTMGDLLRILKNPAGYQRRPARLADLRTEVTPGRHATGPRLMRATFRKRHPLTAFREAVRSKAGARGEERIRAG